MFDYFLDVKYLCTEISHLYHSPKQNYTERTSATMVLNLVLTYIRITYVTVKGNNPEINI